jgi:hypothetical protein
MINHDRWRDQQLGGFVGVTTNAILAQEQVMLNFVKIQGPVNWKWLGNNTEFKNICQQQIAISDNDARGVIFFGKRLDHLTTTELINLVTKIIQDFDYAYVAINRYEVIRHDFELELPDSIEASLDAIMKQCDPRFIRLHTFEHVDGNHLVAAHPMDCYGLCKL